MDRLLSPSSPLHANLKPFTLLPSTTRLFNPFSSTRFSFTSISCTHETPPPFSSSSVPKTLTPLSSSQLIPSYTLVPKSQPLNKITTENNFLKPKVRALCSDNCLDLVCVSCNFEVSDVLYRKMYLLEYPPRDFIQKHLALSLVHRESV